MTDATATSLPSPRRGAMLAIAALTVPVVLASVRFTQPVGCLALVGWLLTAAIVLDRLPIAHPHPRFGLANTVTLGRAAGTVLLAAIAAQDIANPWLLVAAVAALLALDGVDGRAARRQGLASRFGARFDMEVDAALILTLCVLAVELGKAGPWVLTIGLMRYAFVLAARLDPVLGRPLPVSRRRAAVCGLQVATLGLILAPPVAPPLSTSLAAIALAALVWSFALDLAWLRRAL